MPDVAGRSADRYAWLSDALLDGGIVLTASRRLARDMCSAFNVAQMARGASAWDTPHILFWQDWARSIVLQAATPASPRLISRSASTLLWERCLSKQLDGDVLGLGSLTQHAMGAWQRLAQWRLSLDELAASATTRDERLFLRSASDYRRQLRENNWLDPEELVAAAIRAIQEPGFALPSKLLMCGFDRLSPLAVHLLDVLHQGGCNASASAAPESASSRAVHSLFDVESELRAAGAWANSVLVAEPAARIAIVASDLSANAPRYTRLLREGLAPGWQTGGDSYRHAVNVSFGRRLAEYPVIAIALLCLRWASGGLRSRDVSIILRSHFLGNEPTMDGADLDLRLRRLPDRLWSPAALAEALSAGDESGDGGRLAVVRTLAAAQVGATNRRVPSEWAQNIHEVLTDIGWPGHGVLRSDEFQLGNRWRELLNELAGLDLILSAVTFPEAILRLTTLARDAVYQPETGPGLVSLLGALEAAGMEFDHLWIVGTDSTRWPAQGNPLALVSRKLQREKLMPDATPADTLDYSRRVLHRLMASATHVHCSWAQTDGDVQQMLSPLVAPLGQSAPAECPDPGWYAETQLGNAGAMPVDDDPVPPVRQTERLAGGSRTIALQWQEPLLAFATGRLAVSELAAFQSGLTPRLRGDFLHDTLDVLLRDRPTQDIISNWSESDRQRRINRAIERAVRRYEQHADAVLRRLLALERRRLRAMLQAFLLAECERGPFRIERVEEQLEFEHAGLLLTLRADRIDRLPDKSLAIIDYKSGRPRRFLGADGEPMEPQLLVYAAATSDPVGALVLLNISRRSILYNGAGAEWRGVDDGKWGETLAAWKGRVLNSLEAIARGDVRINLHPGGSAHPQLDVLTRVEEERRAR